MDADMKSLVAGILNDLIDARFQADVAVSRLAEHYRGDPNLRALSIPSLNISSVDVDLRFVFGETEKAEDADKSENEAARSLSEALSDSIIRMGGVGDSVKTITERRKLQKTIADKVAGQVRAGARKTPADRQAAVKEQVLSVLASAKVKKLSAADYARIDKEVASADAQFDAIARVGKPTRARLITAPETLAKVNPDMISRVSFSVDLAPKRWETLEGEQAGDMEDRLVDE